MHYSFFCMAMVRDPVGYLHLVAGNHHSDGMHPSIFKRFNSGRVMARAIQRGNGLGFDKNHKSIFWAPQSMQADPSWIQNHLSPMWAQYGVRDTMSYYYPRNKNLTWTYHGREFRYLAYPCLKPSASVNQVIFKKGLKMHASWLRSWAKTNQVFLHKPSPYLIQKFNLNANYLDDGLALRY